MPGSLAGVIAPPESGDWPPLAGTEHSGARDELITRRGELWAVVTTPCLHCTGPVLVYCALYYEITAPRRLQGAALTRTTISSNCHQTIII